jgi:hypothetical protein
MALMLAFTAAGSKGLCPQLQGGGWQDVWVVQVEDEPGGPAVLLPAACQICTFST